MEWFTTGDPRSPVVCPHQGQGVPPVDPQPPHCYTEHHGSRINYH